MGCHFVALFKHRRVCRRGSQRNQLHVPAISVPHRGQQAGRSLEIYDSGDMFRQVRRRPQRQPLCVALPQEFSPKSARRPPNAGFIVQGLERP